MERRSIVISIYKSELVEYGIESELQSRVAHGINVYNVIDR